LYDEPRLDAATRRLTFFRWAHPKIARWCDQNRVAYPPVDEEGEIVNVASWFRAAQRDAHAAKAARRRAAQ
jgi:tRNA (guanosine-2'-O-)-methyltransferase